MKSCRPYSLNVALAILAAATMSCGLWMDDEARIDSAMKASEEGDHRTAIIHLKNVVLGNPSNAQARALLGAELLLTGEYLGADKEFERALQLGFPLDGIREQVIETRLEVGNYEGVLEATDLTMPDDPEKADQMRLFRGAALVGLGNYGEALLSYSKISAASGSYVGALLAMADVYQERGQRDDALITAQTALAAQPESMDVAQTLAGIHLQSGDPHSALAVLKAPLENSKELESHEGYALAYAARAHLDLGQPESASRLVQRLNEIWDEDDAELLLIQGELQLALGDADKASSTIQTALAGYSDWPRANASLGRAQLANGQLGQATANLRAALVAEPDIHRTRMDLARAYVAQEQTETALQVLREGISFPLRRELLSLLGKVDLLARLSPDHRLRDTILSALQEPNDWCSELVSVPVEETGTTEDFVLRALCRLEMGRSIARATDYFDQAAKRGSLHHNDRAIHALAYLTSQDPAPGLALLPTNSDSDLVNDAGRALTMALVVTENPTENIEAAYRDWFDPKSPDLDEIHDRAYLELQIGNLESAIELYKQLENEFGDEPEVLNNLAWAYGQTDQPEAVGYARRAFALAPDDGAVVDTLGWLLFKSGEVEEALALLRRAHVLEPSNTQIADHLVEALESIGLEEEAASLIRTQRGQPREAAW